MKSFKITCAALFAAFSAHAAAVGGLADVTLFDRSDGRQLPVYWHEGKAYVVGNPGNEYAVRIRNRQREDVLGVISVDGVNVITGETALAQQSGYVLAPYRQFDVSGWRKNLASTAAFYFTSLPDSYAARTGRPDNVGVIGVAFYRKREEPAPVAQPALQRFHPEETLPGPAVRSDDEAALAKAAGDAGTTIFHPVGTAKMGLPSDPGAVVDERLRVYGLQGLRVIDASVMPTITSGNTNSPTMMIAEKAAAMIAEDARA